MSFETLETRDPELLPVLPLRDVVVFPSMIFPLLIGRAATLVAIEKAMLNERRILLVTQRDPGTEEVTPADLFEIGVVANVLQTLKLPNGLVKVLVEGVRRAKISSWSPEDDCLYASIEPMEIRGADGAEARAHMKVALRGFRDYVSLNRQLPDEILLTLNNLNEPVAVADFIAAHLPMVAVRKQDILEQSYVPEQYQIINRTLDEEIEILKIERNIEGQVREKISKTQRNFFLQEQMRIIKKELGEESDEEFSDVIAYKKKMRKLRMPKEVRQRAEEEMDKLKSMPMMSPEATVIKNYLDWLFAMPWGVTTTDRLDLAEAQRILDEDHFGLRKPKERILEHLAVLARVEKIRGPILCLVGPPGVGKTSLGRSIARAMGRNFVRISLGGVRDEAEIRGHRRTYIGSMPGRIIQGMKRAGSMNPIFLLDEVDKMSSDFRGDPSSALLEVLDPEQNSTFSDHYLEVDFDLSQILFITTANIQHDIPLPLQDRMEIIDLHGYLHHEKLHIANEFLLPKQIRDHGLREAELSIDPAAMDKIVSSYTRESGVRELERLMARVCRKVARENAREVGNTVVVSTDKLDKLLGAPPYKDNQIDKGDRIGTAVGLAWTSQGGEILNIQASVMKGKGAIQLTGRLGDVMKESAHAAMSFIRAHGSDWGVQADFVQKLDVHFHIPEAATPKDGPSAGITLATALLSALTSAPVPADIAMTGEITLRGYVLPIGGLAEKTMAAKRAGIRKLIVPAENEPDWKELDEPLRDGMDVIFAENITDVWRELFPVKKRSRAVAATSARDTSSH
ncbi:MAG: endopeptidase La [Calditrichaeota bacterium]|nr:endopeptidase La [Calditrichota bacterium]MCB9367878.1 endopeptidase La [Calditrichota bacterium]